VPEVGSAAIAIVSFYVYANVLIVAAATLLAVLRALNGCLPRPVTYGHLLAIGRLLAVTSVLLPLLAMGRGAAELTPLKAQVWAAPSMHAAMAAADARIDVAVEAQHASLPVSAAAAMALVLFAAGLVVTVVPLLHELAATRRAIRAAHVLRRIGSVCILVSDHEQVPFAAWIPGRSYIVLPAALLLRPGDVRLALQHEGRHHRQGDSRFLYAALLGRMLFGINPATHWLSRQLLELQEFACDEALARRADHCAHSYCACLVRVAEAALSTRGNQLRSFMATWSAGVLRRRVEAACRRPIRTAQWPAAAAVGVAATAILAALSALIAAPVQDRRLSRTDAEQLIAATPGSSMWGLQVNDAVLRQLNLLLGTPDGRRFLDSSVARMHRYEPEVLRQLGRYGLPSQLRVVPFTESGYQNLPARTGRGAGMWMFVAPTARRYGLAVSAQRDERLDVAAETGAAMRMFSDLRRRFGNWPLALMAYNAGSAQVDAAMHATRTRDAWALYRAGYGNDPDYLARTTALMLILAHPRLLD
jgi:beta-lactamase regulating signal transducer with metallopeptidase domain